MSNGGKLDYLERSPPDFDRFNPCWNWHIFSEQYERKTGKSWSEHGVHLQSADYLVYVLKDLKNQGFGASIEFLRLLGNQQVVLDFPQGEE